MYFFKSTPTLNYRQVLVDVNCFWCLFAHSRFQAGERIFIAYTQAAKRISNQTDRPHLLYRRWCLSPDNRSSKSLKRRILLKFLIGDKREDWTPASLVSGSLTQTRDKVATNKWAEDSRAERLQNCLPYTLGCNTRLLVVLLARASKHSSSSPLSVLFTYSLDTRHLQNKNTCFYRSHKKLSGLKSI